MSWPRRLLNTLLPSRSRREIERELAFHLTERAEQLRADGVADEEARRRARLQFGNPAVQADRTLDVDIANRADAVLRTIRHAARALRRTPGFSAMVVLTLAAGIGANSAVFSAIDAVLIEPLPFPNSDRLVRVRQVMDTETQIAPARLEDWRRLSTSFEILTGYYLEDASDTTGTLPERIRRAVVAPQFLEAWGVEAILGQGSVDAQARTGGPSGVVISDRYWRRRFGGDPEVLSKTVRIDGQSYAVVGVMPPSFVFPDPTVDIWWPDPIDRKAAYDRELQWYTGIGRLRAGVTLEQAHADLRVVQAQLGKAHPASDAGIGVAIASYKTTVTGQVQGSLWLLFGAVSVLLLIACSNVGALLLSRASERTQEVAVRFALGASRTVVFWQLLTETALLAFLGAAGGLLVAINASSAIGALAPDLPRLQEIGIDGRVLAYTMASAVVVALLCGVLPALRASAGVTALADGGRTQVSGRHGGQWLLVGVQVALSVTLLAGAGVLLRSAVRLAHVDRGFDPANVLAFRVSGNWNEARDRALLVQRIEGTMDQLRALPGVESVATSWSLPGVPRQYQIEFQLSEGRAESEPRLAAEWRTVSPGYFGTLRIPLVAGDMCRFPRTGQPAPEVMVNRSFAERYFNGRSVLGLHLNWEAASQSGRIAGVVADARELGIDRAPAPSVYACDSAPSAFPWFLMRTRGEPLPLAGPVRSRLKELEPLRSVYDATPLEQRIDGAYAQNRLRTGLLALFGATALALACLGVYATLSHAVSRRRREVGLRLALGAPRGRVLGELVGQALRVVSLACLGGLILAVAVNRALSGMLHEVSASDPFTLAGVLMIVLTVGSAAALVPAVRAAQADPLRALRDE